jgi:ABC-type nitrate/sulfonate/bicarbonate transport system substrate-binding protein
LASKAIPIASAGIGVALAPLGAAELGGFFKEQGLDVRRSVIPGAGNVVKALMKGDILFGHFAAHAVIQAVIKDPACDVTVIAGGFNQEFLVGAPGVTDLSQLEGQPVGSGRARDLHHFYIEFTFRELMKKPGIHVDLEHDDRFAALMSGKIKACTLSTPSAVRARQAGCKWLMDYSPYGLSFGFGGIMVRRSVLKSDRAMVDAYLRAHVDGTRKYKADKEFGIEVHSMINEAGAASAETYDVAHKGYPVVPDPATGGMKRIIDFWKSEGVLDQSFSIDRVIDREPILKICGK